MQVLEAALTKQLYFYQESGLKLKTKKTKPTNYMGTVYCRLFKYIESVYLRQIPPLCQILLCSISKRPPFQPDQTTVLQMLVPLETKEPHRDNTEAGFFNQTAYWSLGKDFHSRVFPRKGHIITLLFDDAITLNGRKHNRYFKGLCSPKIL